MEEDSGRRAFYGDPVSQLRTLVERFGNGFSALEKAYEYAIMGEHQWAIRKLRRITDELRAFRRSSGYKRRNWAFKWIPYADFRKGVKRGDWGIRSLPSEPKSSRRRIQFLRKRKGAAFWQMLRATYSALGDHYYVRRHRPRGERLEWPLRGMTTDVGEFTFAQAVEPAVREHAAHYGLDPAFIWALMTVESKYNPWAISHADARGLMQVMPQTGALVTGRMGWPNFGTSLLYEPDVAIEISVWYFYQLLEKFHGQLPLAIASYNAGPHRGAAWLRER